jgi:hypothetical protein
MSDTTTDATTIVNSFVEVWNDADPARRALAMGEACDEDIRYVNFEEAVQGYEGLSRMANDIHAQYPGHSFRRTSGVDVHRGGLRFTWQFCDPNGETIATGMEVATLGPDGRIQSVISFNGALPPSDPPDAKE